MRPSICIVLHDVAPATQSACERVLDVIADIAEAPVTLLAVPRYHGAPRHAAFEHWLRERAACGDEVCLHGYTHFDEGRPSGWLDHWKRRIYTRGEGEFADLDAAAAARRIAAGVRWLQDIGLPPQGFVAPAWLMSQGTREALDAHDFRYTCTLGRIWLLPQGRPAGSQALVYSNANAWRRTASIVWNRTLAALQSRQPLLRLELHPHDADHRAMARSWQHLLREYGNGRCALTLAQAAGALRGEPHAQTAGSGLGAALDMGKSPVRSMPGRYRR